jgi:hypothetical protein
MMLRSGLNLQARGHREKRLQGVLLQVQDPGMHFPRTYLEVVSDRRSKVALALQSASEASRLTMKPLKRLHGFKRSDRWLLFMTSLYASLMHFAWSRQN